MAGSGWEQQTDISVNKANDMRFPVDALRGPPKAMASAQRRARSSGQRYSAGRTESIASEGREPIKRRKVTSTNGKSARQGQACALGGGGVVV